MFLVKDELSTAGSHLKLCGMMDQSSPPTRDRAKSIAVNLYVLRGYDGFSFNDLAEATSTTRANIHHHFGNKRRLMAELIEDFVADAQHRIAEIWTTQGTTFPDRFAGQLEDLRRFHLRYNPVPGDRNIWSPLARLRLDLPVLGELGTSALERVDRVYDASLHQAVADAIRARELAPRTPIEDVTRILRVTLMSCAPMTQDTGSFAELAELLAALYRMIVAGWGRNIA
jgi:AcrR family transcriptional regulator